MPDIYKSASLRVAIPPKSCPINLVILTILSHPLQKIKEKSKGLDKEKLINNNVVSTQTSTLLKGRHYKLK